MLLYANINLISMLLRFEPEEVVRLATDSIYLRKTACTSSSGSGPTEHIRCTQTGIAASVSSATTRQPQGHHEMRLPQLSGVTRVKSRTCLWNVWSTSPSQNTKSNKRTYPRARQHAMTIP